MIDDFIVVVVVVVDLYNNSDFILWISFNKLLAIFPFYIIK
jgi:hypothetical protein